MDRHWWPLWYILILDMVSFSEKNIYIGIFVSFLHIQQHSGLGTQSFFMNVKMMPADEMVTQVAKASSAIILTYFSGNITRLAPEALMYRSHQISPWKVWIKSTHTEPQQRINKMQMCA